MVEGVTFLQENEPLPPCDLSRKSGKAAFSTACPWDPWKLYMLGGSEFRHLRAKSRRKRRLRSETRLRAQCAKVLGPRPKTLVRRKAPPHLRWGPKARKQNAAHMGGILISPADRSALGELGSAASSLEAVLFTP